MQDRTSRGLEGSALDVARDFVAIAVKTMLTQITDAAEFLFSASVARVESLPQIRPGANTLKARKLANEMK